jgi:hypothetical protein
MAGGGWIVDRAADTFDTLWTKHNAAVNYKNSSKITAGAEVH